MSPIYVPGKVVLRKDYIPLDASYNNVSLLLHGNGPNGSTVFTDNSPTPKTVTAVGNAQISTAIADPFGNSTRGVLAFDGTGDYLSASSSSFAFNTNNFTIESWCYFNNASANTIKMIWVNYDTIFAAQSIYFGKHTVSSGKVGVYIFNFSNSVQILTDPNLPPTSTWVHYALVRNGSNLSLYRNGTSVATATFSGSATTNTVSLVGGSPENSGAYSFDVYLDDFRITNSARYTANFTPPTEPFPDRTDG
jgi:hypothetical protein